METTGSDTQTSENNQLPDESAITSAAYKSDASVAQVKAFLAQLQENQPEAYIHQDILSFSGSVEKANWSGINQAEQRHTFSQFVSRSHNRKNIWLCYMDVSTFNWVQDNQTLKDGSKSWEHTPWHSYAIAVIKDEETGFHLVIYDCDPIDGLSEQTRENNLRAPLKKLLAVLRGKGKKTRRVSVWYSKDETNKDKGECRKLSLMQLEAWAKIGNEKHKGQDDERTKDYINISKP